MSKKKNSNNASTQSVSSAQKVAVITDIMPDGTEPYQVDPNEFLPILALRNMVMFPNVVLPVTVGRISSLKVAKMSFERNQTIAVFCQKQEDTESPGFEDLYHTGVVAKVLRVFELPGENTTVLLQSNGPKVSLQNGVMTRQGFLQGQVTEIPEEEVDEDTPEFQALADAVREAMTKFLKTEQEMGGQIPVNIAGTSDMTFLTHFFCSAILQSVPERIKLLEMNNLRDRMFYFLELLERDMQFASLKRDITERTREDLDRQQREYFLQQQIKNIQDELGNGHDSEIDDLRAKAKKKNWDKKVNQMFLDEVNKLERINTNSPDYNVQLNYLQTLLQLPWNACTEDNLDIRNAERVLNKDHYGLEKVKERILEHLAVLKLKDDMKSPIICLYGPPGVGKTSLGRSIAAALKRKYVRMSLGGVHDEAEIRGHRKTYIGAMPGRIIKSLIKAESSNPVLILDEIDKLGNDHRGDPSSALLEVLDPEQNSTFHDNFLDMDYDLSKVMFIATANNIGTIPPPLLDRMELIEVSGYITEEKVEIARKHLIPKEMANTGIRKEDVKFHKSAIEYIIENYTRESGVRELEKKIGKILRKIALEYARDENQVIVPRTLKAGDVPTYLGMPEYSRDKYQGNDYAGVVTGLAWTAVGGEILFVETSLSRGKGGKLTLTGNLGDVMKESAMLALEYLKAHSSLLQLPEDIFENWNIHIHVPEGAIPKDGPSAGITMVTSLASALTQRKVKQNLAMTGEITLRGKVLPVGGIKEKILAAKRAGIKEIILCHENKKNIDDIQPMYLEGLTFHYVTDIKEVLALALTDERVKDAIDFRLPEEPKPENDKPQ
jgi:ATP-dependent Lon protease